MAIGSGKEILSTEFFARRDVVQVAKDLVGMVVRSEIDGEEVAGIITETEAYAGVTDKASHAYGGRRTPRTEVMYAKPGTVYMYLCYGIHHLFNIVTNEEGVPHAVLIRGIKPIEGIEVMERRRGRPASKKGFTSGPGTVSQALGLHTEMTGSALGGRLVIEDHGNQPKESDLIIGPRIGVDYAGEDAKLPYRFLWQPD